MFYNYDDRLTAPYTRKAGEAKKKRKAGPLRASLT